LYPTQYKKLPCTLMLPVSRRRYETGIPRLAEARLCNLPHQFAAEGFFYYGIIIAVYFSRVIMKTPEDAAKMCLLFLPVLIVMIPLEECPSGLQDPFAPYTREGSNTLSPMISPSRVR
jgi:hypothetical protein